MREDHAVNWRTGFDATMAAWATAYESAEQDLKDVAAGLQQGAVDLHVHCDPSLVKRSLDVFEAAKEADAVGMRAIVVKDHHTGTQTQAWLADKYAGTRDSFDVFGSLWLNNFAGGYNVYAVDAAINLGARLIACPTISATGDMEKREASGHGHTHPPDPSLLKTTYLDERPRPVMALDDDGGVRPEVMEVLDRVANAGDVILSTGHLAGNELIEVVRAARRRGILRINMTHALSYSQLDSATLHDLCGETGAYAEFTTGQLMGSGVEVDDIVTELRAVGLEHITYATDAGVSVLPRPVDFHRQGLTFLLQSGFSEAEIRRISSENQHGLLDL